MEHAMSVLEFSRLIDSVCEYAQNSGGIGLIRSLRPSGDLDIIQRRRALYADLIAIRNRPLDIPPLHIDDIGDILRHVAPEGAVLDGVELVACMGVLEVSAAVRDFADQRDCDPYLAMRGMLQSLEPCSELYAVLLRSLDRDGSVLDSASEKLRTLRRQAASLELRIQHHLDQMVKAPEWDNTLQEHFVTVRNGRYVVPVKRDTRNAMPGIVHDLSNSGQTLFVEPTETLGWGNDLVKTRVEEREEIIRILSDLSSRLRSKLGIIQENQRMLAELDAAAAIARWAGYNGCDLPEFGKELRLENARHPLLQMQFARENKGKKVIPLNLQVPNAIKTIAITGSNTGGKTVILKTIGLLCLAAQSGLPVSAGQGSVFQVYDNILADIGDEQSIQANLSTFSAHISNIIGIIGSARQGRSLVLLDELGGGTDPVEGGAIACGIINGLARSRALLITTTHLAMVKNYVHSRPDMLNAAVRFDVKTLQPEYILDVGRPGASHAILIAKRLGMPQEVIADAQKMLTEDQRRLEDMLTRMEADQRRIARHADKLAVTENDLAAKRDALKSELDDLRNQRRQMLEDAHRQAEALVNNTRREMENLIRGIHEEAKRVKDNPVELQKINFEEVRQAIAEKGRRVQAGLKIHSEKAKAPLAPGELKAGLRVWVEKMNAHGIVDAVSANGSKAQVSINGLSVTINASELERNRDGKDKDDTPAVIKIVRPKFEGVTSSELNLVGMRVEEALNELGSYIDRSVLARMPELRIIHGFGTGRLRSAVHEFLQHCPSVKSFRQGRDDKDPGGGGCTYVTLN